MTATNGSASGPANGSGGGGGRGGGKRRRRGGEQSMVDEADFTSYYGRPVVKPPSWKAHNIAGYFTLGGIAAGSSLLAAGGDLTGRPALRRAGRLASVAALSGSVAALVADLGRPERFVNMLRVFRPTSPMSVGSWLLAGYGPLAGAAALAELAAPGPGASAAGAGRLVARGGRVAGLGAALLAPAVASYTATLLSNTAVPLWNETRRELPFVFAGSAASAAGGCVMALAPTGQAGPARVFGLLGTAIEHGAQYRMESRLGTARDALDSPRARVYLRLGHVFAGTGAAAAVLFGRRSRGAAVLSGMAMVAGSACTRFGMFYAGVASAEDPRFTVQPQRERLERGTA